MKTLPFLFTLLFTVFSFFGCSGSSSRPPENPDALINRSPEILQVNPESHINNQPQSFSAPFRQPIETGFSSEHVMVLLPLEKKIAVISQDGKVLQVYRSRQEIQSGSWSSVGSRAVFLTRGQGNTRKISIIGLNGGLSMEMESRNISSPTISGKGDFIAYTSYNDGEFRLNLVSLPSGKIKSVFQLRTEGIAASELLARSRPVISPNGKWVAFSCYTGRHFNVFVWDNEKSIVRNITRNEGVFVEPVFSPNGKYVAYLSREENTQIFIIRNDGRGRKRLTFIPGAKRSVSFSPDGKKIAFISQYKNIHRIYTMNLNGDELKVLRSTRRRITGCQFLTKDTLVFQTPNGVYALSLKNDSVKRLMSGEFSSIALPGR